MNLFKRSLSAKRNDTEQIKYASKMLMTKDIYLTDKIAIDFAMGQELYYYIVKWKNSSNNITGNIISLHKLETELGSSKVLSIGLTQIEGKGFKRECALIDKFIEEAGGC